MNGNEKMLLLSEFLNTSINIYKCMKTKCKIIDKKMNNNPLYKNTAKKILSAKTDDELLKIIDNVISVAEYPNYSKCQHKNCNDNIKNLIIVLLKLYDFYKTKENKKFPYFINNAITTLKLAIENNEPVFIKYDRETNILLSYTTRFL